MGANQTSAVILAGGKSRRLGINKAEVLVAGKSMLQRVLDTVQPLFNDVVLAGAAANLVGADKLKVVDDEIRDVGPLGGLYTGLGAVRNPRSFCIACDMPMVTRKLICQLLSVRTERPAAVFRIGGEPQPLCAIYAKTLRPVILEQVESGDYRLKGLLERVGPLYIELPACEDVRRSFFNVNSAEDLVQVRAILEEGSGKGTA